MRFQRRLPQVVLTDLPLECLHPENAEHACVRRELPPRASRPSLPSLIDHLQLKRAEKQRGSDQELGGGACGRRIARHLV